MNFEDYGRILRAEKATVLNGPLTRVGEITYSNSEVDDVAKSILFRRWKREERHLSKLSLDSSSHNAVFRNVCC